MKNKVNDYISSLDGDKKNIILEFREFIKKIVPKAEETLSYGVPAFKLNRKTLIIYAIFKSHLGIYPGPETISLFNEQKKLDNYNISKGAIKFLLIDPIPYDLVKEILQYNLMKIIK